MYKVKLTHKLSSVWKNNKRLGFVIHTDTSNAFKTVEMKEKELTLITTRIEKADITTILRIHG
jgi:hypothetical protein